jgi:MFS family permease
MKLGDSFPALKAPDYRRWFTGQGVSVVGTWLQNTGQAWLVLSLTDSPFKLGLLSAMQFLPSLLFSSFIGPVIDTLPKRTILLWTQSLFALSAAILAAVAFTGHASYWIVLLIAGLTGLVTAVDWPARQSFVSELVEDRAIVVNALALNSAQFNIARVLGPAIGGVMIALVGIPWTFALNSLSYLAVIASIAGMKAGRISKAKRTGNLLGEMREGWRYVGKNRQLTMYLASAGLISLFVLNFNILIPSFAKLSLGLDSRGYGGLMSSLGAGAFVAAILMSLGGKRLQAKPSVVFPAGLVLCAGMVLTGVQRSPFLAGICLAICGFGMASFNTLCNTAIQTSTEDRMRGRVMSVYNTVFVGATPIGALYVGKLSDTLGPGLGFIISGVTGAAIIFFIYAFLVPEASSGTSPT